MANYTNFNIEELRNLIVTTSKDTFQLWEENKDIQLRFIRDIGEIQSIRAVIQQMESEGRVDQIQQASVTLGQYQRRAAALYEEVANKRAEIVRKLNEGANTVAFFQQKLITEHLFEWKNRQKLAQVGVPFENKDHMLDEIQKGFEFLADHNWDLYTLTCWLVDLLNRESNLSDANSKNTIDQLRIIGDQLTKLLFMLVSQSFVVSVQPEAVLKTQHKFVTEVRLLIGDKLGIRQHMVNTTVTAKIIAEEEAKALAATQVHHKDIKVVGSISNDFEKMTMDERGHLAAKFNNSKLTRIAHRKPPPKCNSELKLCSSAPAATDQKYALLFNISPFQLGNLGKFDVWTLSLPLMVTVHGSQDCDAQGAILWHRAFSNVSRGPGISDIGVTSWDDLAIVIRHKFALFTGARRMLSDMDLAYLKEKLVNPNIQDQKPITFHRFAKMNLRDDVPFSFWEWFFSIMQLIKQKLLKYWDEGWCLGFISKQRASELMQEQPFCTFMLRFSDTQTGAVSIGFVCQDDENQKVPFHLAPFTIKDLEQLSLAQRILTCPQLRDIRFMFPQIDKEDMLRCFDMEERQKQVAENNLGYIQSEIVMVAKTAGRMSSSASLLGGDSPSPLSIQSRNECDWSPVGGDVNPNNMDLQEDLASMLSASGINGMGHNVDVESLLGPGFRPQLPQEPLQQVDLSFGDPFNQQFNHFMQNQHYDH